MMRKALFALAIVFLVSMASAYAQTANADDALLKKNKTQPSVQPAVAPAARPPAGAPAVHPAVAPPVHPAVGASVKPIAKRPAPSPSPIAQKSPRPGEDNSAQQPKFGNAPVRTPPVGAARTPPPSGARVRVPGSTRGSRPTMAADRGRTRPVRPNRIGRAPSAMDPNDPLTKLYEARRLLNQLSATDPIDTRKEAYVEARQLVSQAIRTINAARSGP